MVSEEWGKERKDGRRKEKEVKGGIVRRWRLARTHRYGFTSGFGQSRIEIRPVINYGSGLQASSRGSRSVVAQSRGDSPLLYT